MVITVVGVIFDLSAGTFSGILAMIGVCIVGWLITRHMARRYGIPTKFPAIGAKVMTTMIVLMWVIIGVVYVGYLAITHFA